MWTGVISETGRIDSSETRGTGRIGKKGIEDHHRGNYQGKIEQYLGNLQETFAMTDHQNDLYTEMKDQSKEALLHPEVLLLRNMTDRARYALRFLRHYKD